MLPDINRENQTVYYKKENGEYTEIGVGTNLCALGDYDKEYVNYIPSGHAHFDFKMTKKSMYRIQKLLGLIKPVYKRKKKGKRYILYEIIQDLD